MQRKPNSSLKLDKDLLDNKVTLVIFEGKKELLPKQNIHVLLCTVTSSFLDIPLYCYLETFSLPFLAKIIFIS